MNGGSRNPIAQVERTESSVLVNADPDGEFGTNTASAPTSLIPGLLALDTALSLLPRLLKQSTPASIQWSWDQKEIMRNGSESIRVLINHWRWLRANGYKKEATSCKLQAASLTRKNYRIIKEVESRNYENK